MERRIFKLSPRLLRCAENVRVGKRLVDVGTDHAYLPIWLAMNSRIDHAVCADVNEGPLVTASNNIKRYGVGNKVETLLSDGLCKVDGDMVDDVVIAGMGGDLIVRILENVTWIRNSDKRLILQPMTCEEKVRLFLCENGFEIINESTVLSEGRVYVVMVCSFSGKTYEYDEKFLYLGKVLESSSETNIKYLERVYRHLRNKSLSNCLSKQVVNVLLEIEKILSSYKDVVENDVR